MPTADGSNVESLSPGDLRAEFEVDLQPSASSSQSVGARTRGPRAEIVEEISLAMAGSLNLRRCVLQLLTAVRPEIADWAMVVLTNPRTGALSLYGGDDPAATGKASRRSVANQALDRILTTGRTELLHVSLDTAAADGLASMVATKVLREQAARLRPVDVLGLVPAALPAVPGVDVAARYRPAIEQLDIGGDFYDMFGAEDDWLAVLGDVCGKGVDAAVLTGRARQSLRTAAHFERRPGALLSAFNTVFYEDTSDRFITLVCVRLKPAPDGRSADVEIAVAGHAGPVVVRADGRAEQLEIEGTVAGVLPDVDYPATTIRLEQGDALLLFTDGVEEARGEDGFYGLDRLLALL